jgi:hypothetical protein
LFVHECVYVDGTAAISDNVEVPWKVA